jgi:hypothetical protein
MAWWGRAGQGGLSIKHSMVGSWSLSGLSPHVTTLDHVPAIYSCLCLCLCLCLDPVGGRHHLARKRKALRLAHGDSELHGASPTPIKNPALRPARRTGTSSRADKLNTTRALHFSFRARQHVWGADSPRAAVGASFTAADRRSNTSPATHRTRTSNTRHSAALDLRHPPRPPQASQAPSRVICSAAGRDANPRPAGYGRAP